MVEHLASSVTRTKRKRVLLLFVNGIGGILGVSGAIVRFSSNAASVGETVYIVAAVGLLFVGEFLFWFERYRWGGICAIVGGLALFPLGAVSLSAGVAALKRTHTLHSQNTPKTVCLKCGYDLKGLTALRCPECGCAFGFTKSWEELGLSMKERQSLPNIEGEWHDPRSPDYEREG